MFVHGAGGSIHTWKKNIDFFKPHYNLLLFDIRDHGNSRDLVLPDDQPFSFELLVDDIIELMDHLELKNVHVVGISLGSIFVRMIEEARPKMVSSIVLGGGVFNINWKLQILMDSGVLLSKFLNFHTLYKILAHIVLPNKNHKKSRDIFIREAEKVKQEAFDRWLTILSDVKGRVEDHFNNPTQAPTMVLMGEQDHVFLQPALAYARKYTDIKVKVFEKCGHVCNIERADLFNFEALNFIRNHDRTSGLKFSVD